MLGDQHYQQDVLSALLKWTLRVGQLTAFRWGAVSIIFYEAGLLARFLFPARDLGLHIDEISLYTVPPIILIFFAIIGRIMTRYLIGALTESEAARHDLARS